MKNYTPDYEYKQVNTKEIFVDALYQRDLEKKKVNKIVKKYNPYLINAPKLSFRDGRMWVFDGQHTVAAVKAKHGGKDCSIECKVFYGLTRLDEMELFIAQNGESSPVRTAEKFRALYNNGDKEICEMVHLIEMAGLEIDFTKGQARNRVIAHAAVYKAYKMLTPIQFVDMLSILREAWDGSQEGLSGEIIKGMAKFYQTYDGEFNRKRVISQLKKVSPLDIVRESRGNTIVGKNGYARTILRIYNVNTSTNRLDDKL